MMYDFNADDMFEIAVQLERNGAKFYRDARCGRKRRNPTQAVVGIG